MTLDKDSPTLRISEPKFSEPIQIGEILGKPVTVCRPLNDDAYRQSEPIGIALLVMHDRMVEMQNQIDELKAKPDDT